jgi:hypothetical protein
VVHSTKSPSTRGLWLLLLCSTILTLSVFELFFRWVLPATRLPLIEYDHTFGILHYQIHGRKEGISTTGRDCERPVRWRINNEGWNSAIDYAPAGSRSKPLVALIGDSYIEALQVNVGQSVVDDLRRRQAGRREVYGFGFGGAPLSQYLQMSRYVREVFHPDTLVFSIVDNDFDESVRELVPLPHFLQLTSGAGGLQEVPPAPYVPSRIKRLAAHSAIVRYLWFNLHLPDLLQSWKAPKVDPGRFYGSVDALELQRNRELVERATFKLVEKIRQENPGTEILFMFDAARLQIYDGKPGQGRLGWLHQLVRSASERNACRFLDLTQPFRERYERDHVPLNFSNDYHWNAVAHALAAEVLDTALNENQSPIPAPTTP